MSSSTISTTQETTVPSWMFQGVTEMKGRTVSIDFETFYDSKNGYSLRKMTPHQYVTDARFDPYLVAIVSDLGEKFVGRPQAFHWGTLDGATLVAHNASFDGMVLNRMIELGMVPNFKRELICTADMVAYLNRPRNLKDASKCLLGKEMSKAVREDMDGKSFNDVVSQGVAKVKALLDYASLDAENCLAIFLQYGHEFPQRERDISKRNREAGWEGIAIDTEKLQEGLQTLKRVKWEAEQSLPWVEAGEKAASRNQLALHARSLGLEVPASFKKDDPEMMAWVAKYADDHPFIQARLNLASVNPHIARLESLSNIVNADGIARIPIMYHGTHCLSGDHEVLTRDGWVKLEDWSGGEIMQWESDFLMRFAPAKAHRFENTEKTAVRFNAPYIKAKMTLGHTVPTFSKHNWAFKPMRAEDFINRSGDIRVPVSGICEGGTGLTPEQMRVIVATQADGSFTKRNNILLFSFRKGRKVDRIQKLLREAGVPFSVKVFPSCAKQVCVTIPKHETPAWLHAGVKLFGPWLLNSSAEARFAFVEELTLWDGYTPKDPRISGQYYTSVRQNAEWVATILHLCGRSSGRLSIREAKGNRREAYTVTIKPVMYSHIYGDKGNTTVVASDPVVYCPETETGFFLVRYQDTISITGNTGRASGGSESESKFNILNIPKSPVFGVDMRAMIKPRPGYVFAIYDFCQIEARIVQWLAGNEDFLKIVREEGNMYQAAAKIMGWFPRDGKDLKKKDPLCYQLSKSISLGLGFGMGTPKFMMSCEKMGTQLPCHARDTWDMTDRHAMVIRNAFGIDPKNITNLDDEAKVGTYFGTHHIVEAWRKANPQVVQLWRTLQDDLDRAARGKVPYHTFTLPSGRKKRYFNPHHAQTARKFVDPVTGEEMTRIEKRIMASTIEGKIATAFHGGPLTENIVQATARDVMYWGAMDVTDDAGWICRWNAYDEVIFEVPKADAERSMEVIPHFLCHGSATEWTEGLPLEVEGGIFHHYTK